MNHRLSKPEDWLLASLMAVVVATLVHHVHNAQFLRDYPNMPAWSAPLAAHTPAMNATILLEAAAGVVLALLLLWPAFSSRPAR